MILTFAKLQRLSRRVKPTAVKAWLKREGIAFARDANGNPWTTLDAVNRKLQRAADDGFTLEDPERGLPEERPVVSRRPEQVDRAVQGRRRIGRVTGRVARSADNPPSPYDCGATGLLSSASRDRTGN